MVVVSRDRCLMCGKALAAPIAPAATPCAFCGSRFRILNTDHKSAVIINPPFNFYRAEALHHISELLASSDGRGVSLVFDFSRAPFICSAAIGALLALRKGMTSPGDQIRLVLDMGKSGVRQFLDQTYLDRLFPVFGSVEEAVQAP